MYKKALITTACLSIVAFTFSVQAQDLDDILKDILGPIDTQEEVKEEAPKEMEMDTKNKTVGEIHGTAADILEQLDDGNRTYVGGKTATAGVVKTEKDAITLNTTKALYNGKDVLSYQVFYSTTALSSQKFSEIESKVIKGKDTGDKVELILDGLKENTTYYAVVAPSNPDDIENEPLDKITSEIRFKTSQEEKEITPPTKDTPKEEIVKPTLPAELENPSYTTNNNNIELTWKAKNIEDHNVEISLRHANDVTFSSVGNIKAMTQVFSFSVDKSGAYLVKMKIIDKNGKQIGADKNLNLKVDEFQKDIATTITNPPKVGPTTDILIALMLFAAMIYIVYRVRRVESK